IAAYPLSLHDALPIWFLHSQLRDFDTYYRVADLQFLVILPGANTAEAARTAEQLRRGLCTLMTSHGLKLTVSVDDAGLNIGDDRSEEHTSELQSRENI